MEGNGSNKFEGNGYGKNRLAIFLAEGFAKMLTLGITATSTLDDGGKIEANDTRSRTHRILALTPEITISLLTRGADALSNAISSTPSAKDTNMYRGAPNRIPK